CVLACQHAPDRCDTRPACARENALEKTVEGSTVTAGRISRRVGELDATRGAAMFFVCLSHSAAYVSAQSAAFARGLIAVGMIATPTFLLLSGIVCGYLGNAEEVANDALPRRLLDRGLFLLLVVHVLLGFIHATWWPLVPAMTGSFYITDAVAV